MRAMRRSLLLLVVPLAAILVGVWALRSEDALELDPVASAATKTTDAGSARMAFALKMNGGGRTVQIAGRGAFDFEASRGTVTMDASKLLPAAADGRFELRLLGPMIYMRMPATLWPMAGATAGKSWIGIDVRKSLKAAGLGSLDPTSLQQDPAQTLRLLRASSTSVEEQGTATVRGVQTTRYTAKLDLSKAIEATGDELGLSEQELEQLRQAAERMATQAGLRTIPVQIFVDDDGLLRRLRMSMRSTIASQPFALTQTTDFFDFGVAVNVQAPPASQVLDLSSLAGP